MVEKRQARSVLGSRDIGGIQQLCAHASGRACQGVQHRFLDSAAHNPTTENEIDHAGRSGSLRTRREAGHPNQPVVAKFVTHPECQENMPGLLTPVPQLSDRQSPST